MKERSSGGGRNCTVAVVTGGYDKNHPSSSPPPVDPFQIPAPSASPVHTSVTVTLHPTLVRSLPWIQASSCAVLALEPRSCWNWDGRNRRNWPPRAAMQTPLNGTTLISLRTVRWEAREGTRLHNAQRRTPRRAPSPELMVKEDIALVFRCSTISGTLAGSCG